MMKRGAGRVAACVGAVLAAAVLVGCDKRPEGVLSDSEMENLLTDMILADAYQQTPEGRAMPDSVRRHLGESVMKAHGVDYEVLDSTYAWYARNLDVYHKLYGRVQKRVDNRRRRLAGAAAAEADRNANNIWRQPPHVTFSPLAAADALVFEIGGEAIDKGDRLEWKMYMGNAMESTMSLGVDYTDGTTLVVERTFHGEPHPSLTLAGDTGRVASRIFGVLSVPREHMPVYADSIMLVKQPYDSAVYRNSWSQRLFHAPRGKEKPKPAEPDSVAADSAVTDTAAGR